MSYWFTFGVTVFVISATLFGLATISWLLTGWPNMPHFMGIKNKHQK